VLDAHGRNIVTLDVDLSTDIEAIPRALRALADGYAVVFGDRHHPESSITRRQPPMRERGGAIFNRIAHQLVWKEIRDFTCGFKGYRREAARLLFEQLSVARWAYDVELFAIAKQEDLKVQGLSVLWHNHSDTRVKFPRDGVRALYDLLLVVLRQRSGGYRT
jgi:hypothetical protein